VDQHGAQVVGRVKLRLQRGRDCGGARVIAATGQRLVGDQLRLHHHPQRLVERLHAVVDGGDRPLSERDEAGRGDLHALARG
jgi:hypothetical protein